MSKQNSLSNIIFSNLDDLIDHIKLNANDNFVILVMFKSSRCPPCIETSRMLREIDDKGYSNFEVLSKDFCDKILENNKKIGGFLFLEYDCTSDESISNFSGYPKANDLIKLILKAKQSIRSVPTFMTFVKAENVLNLNRNHSGLMRADTLHVYLDLLVKDVVNNI